MIEYRGSERKAHATQWMTLRMALAAALAMGAAAWIAHVAPGSDRVLVLGIAAIIAVAAIAGVRLRDADRIRRQRVFIDEHGVDVNGTRLPWKRIKYHAVMGNRLVLVGIDGPVEIPDAFGESLASMRDEIARHVRAPELEELLVRQQHGRAVVRDHGRRIVWTGAPGAAALIHAVLLGYVTWTCRQLQPFSIAFALGTGILAAFGVGALLAWPPRRVRACTVIGPEFVVHVGPHPVVVWRGSIERVNRAASQGRLALEIRSRNGHVDAIPDLDLASALCVPRESDVAGV